MKLPLVRRAFACLAMCVAVLASNASATGLEREIKAAFLFRFVEYVRWPQSAFSRPDSPIVIGILAEPSMVNDVQAVIAGRSVRGRPLVVKQMREGGDFSGLHVLFLGEHLNNRLARIIRAVDGPVLIVSEAEDGLGHGSVINFVIADRRVRFEVALSPAGARSLAIGSGLLSVAINVRKDSLYRPPFMAVLADAGTDRVPE